MPNSKVTDLLNYASEQYYNGTPVMSDEQFDALSDIHNYKQVGHSITNGVPHLYRMYSLKKIFSKSDASFDVAESTITPKLDGAAVSLLYCKGEFTLALTRGDGKIGRDITDKMKFLVPNRIDKFGTYQITGEVVAPKSIDNSRNYASGSLNLKSLEEFSSRTLEFFAYGIEPFIEHHTYAEDLLHLKELGFKTVFTDCTEDYPKDGEVLRVNDNKLFASLGFTSHHPRGAAALKERKAGVVTKLLDVKWQVGKSGVVSPVGIFEPVEIDGAKISRATLHNMAYIRELNLEIGCSIEVIRSGDIIPRVVRRVDFNI